MLARTHSPASDTNYPTQPRLTPVPARPLAGRLQFCLGLSLVLLIAAASWLASAHLLEGWQFH